MDTAAVLLGPTGLAYDELSDTLYDAATGDNANRAVIDYVTNTFTIADLLAH